jgi:type II secretory pathway predicted ATPase ExeA
MIRSYFGISKNPFDYQGISLLPSQQEIFDILKVHCRQGGFCLLMGESGTGKSILKEAIKFNQDKRMTIVSISRTLQSYTNIIKLLCQAFSLPSESNFFKCEKNIIEHAHSLHRNGKMITILIDEAHLMEINTLRKIRLMLDDFPNNFNLILIGQPSLLKNISLGANDDLKTRITYSVTLKKLNPDALKQFILDQLDLATLPHNIFTDDALDLIVRSCDGIIRLAKNLCLSCMLETVRKQSKSIGLDTVNYVLLQPHWKYDFESEILLNLKKKEL